MIELLKESTDKELQELERVLIPLIKEVNTLEKYVSLLALLYGYYYPLEQHIAGHTDISFPGGFDRRRKAPLLLDDITVINGAPAAELPLCTDLPEITDNAQALGAMYVLENFTMRGQVISQMLLQHLQTTELPKAMTFFQAYGSDTESYWDTFAHYVQGYRGTEEQQERVLGAAVATLQKFKAWLSGAQELQ